MSVYKGFSSYQFEENKQFVQTDLELVKTDIIAHIFTTKGSRVMMPTFGTLIPEILFEPLDDITTELVEDELRAVFDYDPRVEIVNFEMTVDLVCSMTGRGTLLVLKRSIGYLNLFGLLVRGSLIL